MVADDPVPQQLFVEAGHLSSGALTVNGALRGGGYPRRGVTVKVYGGVGTDSSNWRFLGAALTQDDGSYRLVRRAKGVKYIYAFVDSSLAKRCGDSPARPARCVSSSVSGHLLARGGGVDGAACAGLKAAGDTESRMLLGIDDVQAAAERLRGMANRTPVVTSRTLDELAGAEVFLKAESFQRGGAFKFRGAYNGIAADPPSAGYSPTPPATTPRRSRSPRACSVSRRRS